ncbi:hypothetical protein CLOSTMETH_02091 [[Clostridium] methylpentosum DSM 5476]|uniref:Uncharacterized protein n=1 Tax=[Clostridium] methylpentosum DSM 5476 TaxID=537013 RepID=C0EE12_9FIRM|nr:hypothetical protein CLOSTMETH_02091 [[Clostridium] methylpentosum DSM 5476]
MSNQYPFQGSASTVPSGVCANHSFTSGLDLVKNPPAVLAKKKL